MPLARPWRPRAVDLTVMKHDFRGVGVRRAQRRPYAAGDNEVRQVSGDMDALRQASGALSAVFHDER